MLNFDMFDYFFMVFLHLSADSPMMTETVLRCLLLDLAHGSTFKNEEKVNEAFPK